MLSESLGQFWLSESLAGGPWRKLDSLVTGCTSHSDSSGESWTRWLSEWRLGAALGCYPSHSDNGGCWTRWLSQLLRVGQWRVLNTAVIRLGVTRTVEGAGLGDYPSHSDSGERWLSESLGHWFQARVSSQSDSAVIRVIGTGQTHWLSKSLGHWRALYSLVIRVTRTVYALIIRVTRTVESAGLAAMTGRLWQDGPAEAPSAARCPPSREPTSDAPATSGWGIP